MDITNDLSDSQGSSDVVDTFEDSSKSMYMHFVPRFLLV